MAYKSWIGAIGADYNNPANWNPSGVPKPGDSVTLIRSAISTTNVSIPQGVTLTGSNDAGDNVLIVNRQVSNAGTIGSSVGSLDIAVADHATMRNSGVLTVLPGFGASVIDVSLGADSRLINTGTIGASMSPSAPGPIGTVTIGGITNTSGLFVNDGTVDAVAGNVTVDVASSGKGVFDLGSVGNTRGTVEFGSSVDAGETVEVNSGHLLLDHAMQFHGVISDFTSASLIQLNGVIGFSDMLREIKPGLDQLSIFDATHKVVAQLDFSGQFAQSDFGVGFDAGHTFIIHI